MKPGPRALRRKVRAEATTPGAKAVAWRWYMRALGSKGGKATWSKYARVPVPGSSAFLIVNRQTREVARIEQRPSWLTEAKAREIAARQDW